MVQGIPNPQLTPDEARSAQDVLLEQERILRYERFGADEALRLGGIVASLTSDFDEGVSVTITRESDGVKMYQWVADDKGERNLLFAEGKRVAARKAGHAGPWAQLQAAIAGDASHVWDNAPTEVPACGAFPIRVQDEWVATIAVSGYHDGLDHEIILRAMERALDTMAPRWSATVM